MIIQYAEMVAENRILTTEHDTMRYMLANIASAIKFNKFESAEWQSAIEHLLDTLEHNPHDDSDSEVTCE
ncbi:MAG: hypothetical protein AAF126_10950 [Chloroflexota bacterium]